MRKKLLAGLMLLAMTASSFSTVGYLTVYAAGYEDDTVAVTEEASSVEDAALSDEEAVKMEQNMEAKGSIVDSGNYGTWTWSLDADGVLLIDGTDINIGDLLEWPWKTYREQIKEAKVTGSGSGNLGYFLSGCTAMTSLDMSDFDTTAVTDLSYMLWCCYELESLDLGDIDTSNVTNMECMFGNCTSLTSLDVSKFDTGNVTNMYGVFRDCNGLTSLDLRNFDTRNVTSMYAMFNKCSKLTSIDVSSFDTSEVTDMSSVFSGCSSLTDLNIDNFNTAKVVNISYMFSGCKGLTSVDVSKFDTGNVEDMSYMFYGCSGLTDLDVSNFDAGKVTNMSYMLNGCSSLTKIKSPYNITVKADLPSGVTWVDDSGKTVTTMNKECSESVTYSIKGSQEQPVSGYTVQFDGNKATNGSMSNQSWKAETTYTLPANGFTRTGYLFNGWNTASDGSGDAYADKAEVKNLSTVNGGIVTLYAQWKPIAYTIRFNQNGATGGSMDRVYLKYGKYYKLPSCGFQKPGYLFTGWNTKKDGSGTTYKNQSGVKNLTTVNGKVITLYAQWKKVTVRTAGKPRLANSTAGKLTVAYDPVSGATGYYIQYSTNKNMTNAKNITCTGTKKYIYKLKKGTTYYVRVRAYRVDSAGKKVYGKYGAIQSKKIIK